MHGDGIYGDDERVRVREEDVRGDWVSDVEENEVESANVREGVD